MKQNNDVYKYVQQRDNKDTLAYVPNQNSFNNLFNSLDTFNLEIF